MPMKSIASFNRIAPAARWSFSSVVQRCLLVVPLGIGSLATNSFADEGMYPISELERLQLPQKGLALQPSEIFNPDQVSLVDGICRVNGCTGSFVSDQGLIITNHHCAFDAIQKVSTADKDYLTSGFVSRSHVEELPAAGYTVRITEQYEDVSAKVLSSVDASMSATDRTKAIDKRRKELEKEAETKHPGLRAEVAEMFTGKTYVLFLYTYLKDIRLVFAPPASVGAFGGETDNWEWPRHTGDFSFLRAYTTPDGSSAEYSPDNIPYRPKRFIQVNPQGAEEEDFVFILGYPGRTLRQRTASYFEFEQQIRLPEIVRYYSWQMQEMEKAGAQDRSVALNHATRYKSLANVEKRSRGQLLGLTRTGLIETRRQEEEKLKKFIASDPALEKRFGGVLERIGDVYAEINRSAKQEIALRELRTACRLFSFAFTIVDAVHERQKEDLERESPYMDRNLPLTTKQLQLDIADWHPDTDRIFLRGLIDILNGFPQDSLSPRIVKWLDSIDTSDESLKSWMASTRIGDASFAVKCLEMTPEQLSALNDPALQAMLSLYPEYLRLRELDKEREGKLNPLYGELQDVKQKFQADAFVPDANATLRLTYGRVRGYSPADAVIRTPISTLRGVLEKTTGIEPFISPKEVIQKAKQKEFGPFVHPRLKDVPVAILYNTDTTGGNSGSPVLNHKGELVAVNFDRTFEATINDFAWNESYSRSIGVDVRYVLWITGIVYGADHLLKEMGL
ncbi:S46 family peptidase [Pirellula sp. SH-Sr6A]|uniref:S46 family peptidase n=1 Tax=Pirellula sp. SH-Sr6A TaxID=1632865 RepID=UPI0011BA8FE2|nr:S46 family peptidase [Pirellula sp. SH-Sr6A]